jgi:hypothetical protein
MHGEPSRQPTEHEERGCGGRGNGFSGVVVDMGVVRRSSEEQVTLD